MKIKTTILTLFLSTFVSFVQSQNAAFLDQKDGFYGFRNQKGEWFIEPKYGFIHGSYADRMIAQNLEKTCGVINRKGDTLVPFEFQDIQKVNSAGYEREKDSIVFDAFTAKKGEKWGLIDSKGQSIVPFEYEIADWVDDSTVFFSRFGRQIVRNHLGQTILETDFEEAKLLKYRDKRKSRHLVVTKNDFDAVFDFSKNMIVPFCRKFVAIELMAAGNLARVQSESVEWGVWDLSGRELLPTKFGWFGFLTDSLFVAKLFDGSNAGLFDVTGRQRMPCEFAEIEPVGQSGRIKARKKDTQFGLFDTEGNALTFLELSDFKAEDRLPALIFAKYQDGKWAVLNRDGRHLHFPPLDDFLNVSKIGFSGKLGDLRAVFLPNGNRITDFKYSSLTIFSDKDPTRKREAEHGLNAETYFVGFSRNAAGGILIDNFGKEYPLEPPPKPAPDKPKSTDPVVDGTAIPPDDNQKIHDFPEKQPQFPGGDSARNQFIVENLKYPDVAKKKETMGTVFIQFVVEKDGSISSPVVLKDIGSGCGEAALECIKKMPRWSPAEQNGRAVRAKFTQPVRFKL